MNKRLANEVCSFSFSSLHECFVSGLAEALILVSSFQNQGESITYDFNVA